MTAILFKVREIFIGKKFRLTRYSSIWLQNLCLPLELKHIAGYFNLDPLVP